MGRGLIVALSLYLLTVGWKGKAGNLADNVGNDFKGFIPWAAAILTLQGLRLTPAKDLVNPFIALATMTVILREYPAISQQARETYTLLME